MPTLTLPLSPGANRQWRTCHNRTVLSKEARVFKTMVWHIARQQGLCNPQDGAFMVEVSYHPKARKKKTTAPLRRLDVDAPIKGILDALIGIAYHDDYQVEAVTCCLADPIPNGALIVTWRTL